MADKVTLLVQLEQIEKGIDNLSQKNVALEIKLMQAEEIIKKLLWDLRNRLYDPAKDIERAEKYLGRNEVHFIKEPMTEKQKSCIDWIEETTGAVYEGGSVSDFINEHIEEARFKSELEEEANDPNG